MQQRRVEALDPQVASKIAVLQKQNYKIMALTSRSIEGSRSTAASLNRNGFDFTGSALKFQDENYRNGVYYTNGYWKGGAMRRIFEKMRRLPKFVAFADDNHNQVLSLSKAIEATPPPMKGYCYQLTQECPRFSKEVIREEVDRYLRALTLYERPPKLVECIESEEDDFSSSSDSSRDGSSALADGTE